MIKSAVAGLIISLFNQGTYNFKNTIIIKFEKESKDINLNARLFYDQQGQQPFKSPVLNMSSLYLIQSSNPLWLELTVNNPEFKSTTIYNLQPRFAFVFNVKEDGVYLKNLRYLNSKNSLNKNWGSFEPQKLLHLAQ